MPEQKKYKQYVAKVETDDDERTVTAIISTDMVDRDGEVMKPGGADIENFKSNPVVLWAHDYHTPPIGKSLWIIKSRKNIKAKIKFADTARAEEVYQLYKGGYLNAFSINFIPITSHRPEPKEIEKKPELANAKLIIDEWELLEFSAVPVPANPEALSTAVKAKDISVSDDLQKQLGIEEEETTHILTSTLDVKLEPILKPEETQNYIRVPVRECKITATITISAKEGIKGLYCGKVKKVATYLFDKDKGWTMAKAKAWVKEHDPGKAVETTENIKAKKHPKVKKSLKGKLRRHIDPNECAECVEKILGGKVYR